jgi:hypothetical protein
VKQARGLQDRSEIIFIVEKNEVVVIVHGKGVIVGRLGRLFHRGLNRWTFFRSRLFIRSFIHMRLHQRICLLCFRRFLGRFLGWCLRRRFGRFFRQFFRRGLRRSLLGRRFFRGKLLGWRARFGRFLVRPFLAVLGFLVHERPPGNAEDPSYFRGGEKGTIGRPVFKGPRGRGVEGL